MARAGCPAGACGHTGGEPGTRHWASGEVSHWGSLSSSFSSLDCFLSVCFVLEPSLARVDVVGMDLVGLGPVLSLAHPRKSFFHLIFSEFLCCCCFRVTVNNADNLHIHICENGGAEPVGRGLASFRSTFSVSLPRGRREKCFLSQVCAALAPMLMDRAGGSALGVLWVKPSPLPIAGGG